MSKQKLNMIPNFPGSGHNPDQQTFILMWNPSISSATMEYHKYCIENFDTEPFNWSVYEWEKAHEGDRFYLVRVGDGNTGIVMSGIFTSDPYLDDDWNENGGSRQIHYMDMKPNFIVNPETMPIITTAQLQDAIPDFNWSKGHSGTLLTRKQSQQLERLFKKYLTKVMDKSDDKEMVIDTQDRSCRFKQYLDSQGDHIDTIMPVDILFNNHLEHIIKHAKLYGTSSCIFNYYGIQEAESDFLALRYGSEMGLLALIRPDASENGNEMMSLYPMHQGTVHHVKITEVREFKSRLEAVISAETGELSFAFFATDYFLNRDKYICGTELNIELSASAYTLEEGESETVLDLETSARLRKDMGLEEEYDENGNIKPIIFYNDMLVGFIPESEDYSDNVSFASTVKSVKKMTFLGDDFFRATISICHDPEEMYIPLYLRKDLMENIHKGTLLRGALWMQGRIPNENK